jgi:UV DNA damage repair endonuclease
MVTIKVSGMKDLKLHPREFNEMAMALKTMVSWGVGGMYGDGEDITEKAEYARAKRVLAKLGYK